MVVVTVDVCVVVAVLELVDVNEEVTDARSVEVSVDVGLDVADADIDEVTVDVKECVADAETDAVSVEVAVLVIVKVADVVMEVVMLSVGVDVIDAETLDVSVVVTVVVTVVWSHELKLPSRCARTALLSTDTAPSQLEDIIKYLSISQVATAGYAFRKLGNPILSRIVFIWPDELAQDAAVLPVVASTQWPWDCLHSTVLNTGRAGLQVSSIAFK